MYWQTIKFGKKYLPEGYLVHSDGLANVNLKN